MGSNLGAMRPAIQGVKAIGAAIAAIGAVGIAINHQVHPEAARAWLMVWVGGAAPWLIGNLFVPEPGYRLISRLPFLEKKADLAAELDTGRWIRVAIVVNRVAVVVNSAAMAVVLVKEIRNDLL